MFPPDPELQTVVGPPSPMLVLGSGPDEAASDPESDQVAPDRRSADARETKSESFPNQAAPSQVAQPSVPSNAARASDVNPGGVSSSMDLDLPPVEHIRSDQRPEDERPAKVARSEPVKHQRLQAVSYCHNIDKHHGDADVALSFEEAELDMLEDYEYEFWDEEDCEDAVVTAMQDIPEVLWRPYGPEDPELSLEELAELDEVGDRFELERLLGMGVLRELSPDDPSFFRPKR